jgi:hypothetical protein
MPGQDDRESMSGLDQVPAGDMTSLLSTIGIDRNEVLNLLSKGDGSYGESAEVPYDLESIDELHKKIGDLASGLTNRIILPTEGYEPTDERFLIGGLMEHEVSKHLLNRISVGLSFITMIPENAEQYVNDARKSFEAFFVFADCYQSLIEGNSINISDVVNSIAESRGSSVYDSDEDHQSEIEILGESSEITTLIQFLSIRTFVLNALQARSDKIKISVNSAEGILEASIYDTAKYKETHGWGSATYTFRLRGDVSSLDEPLNEDDLMRKQDKPLEVTSQRAKYIFNLWRKDLAAGVEGLATLYQKDNSDKLEGIQMPLELYLQYVMKYGEKTKDRPGEDTEQGMSLAAALLGKVGGKIELSKSPVIMKDGEYKSVTMQIPANISQK